MKNKLMNRLLIVILALALTLAATSACAADSKPVSYKSGDETVQGILYTPSGKGPFPALVVIHEFWGLNELGERASREVGRPGVCLARHRSIIAAR